MSATETFSVKTYVHFIAYPAIIAYLNGIKNKFDFHLFYGILSMVCQLFFLRKDTDFSFSPMREILLNHAIFMYEKMVRLQ